MISSDSLKAYNSFMINSLKTNKFTILMFSTLTAIGYLSIPYLEKYHKQIKNESKNK